MIGAILAGAYGNVTPTGDFDSIATTTVGVGGAASVVFNSIPSTYQHLQIRYISKNGTAAGDTRTHLLIFNSDTTSANYYSRHILYGDGTSAVAGANSVIGSGGAAAGANSPQAASNVFGVGVIDILDYQNTNKYKTIRTLSGYDTNGAGFAIFNSSLWKSTSAITAISIVPSADNLGQYSSFALYGIKG